MPKVPKQNWRAEFEQLGMAQVRAKMRGNEWNRDKKAAARVWIENSDAHAWQQKHKAGNSQTPLMLRIRTAKWWRYVAPGFAAAMGIGRLIRRLKAF